MWKRRQKDPNSQRRQCLLDTTGLMQYELTETSAAYTGPAHVQASRIPHMEEKNGLNSSPIPRTFFKLIPTGRGKISFLQWNDPEFINHTLGQDPYLEAVDPHKMDSTFVCVHALFCFANFCLFFSGVVSEKEKEHEV